MTSLEDFNHAIASTLLLKTEYLAPLLTAVFSMILSAQEGRLTRSEIVVLMKTLGRQIEKLSPWFQELVDLMVQVIRLQEIVEYGNETGS